MIEYTDEQIKEQRRTFNLFFAKFGQFDYVKYMYCRVDDSYTGYYRFRCYHDGGWLEGYDLEEVTYWGA